MARRSDRRAWLDAVKGIGLALVAAYGFSLLFTLIQARGRLEWHRVDVLGLLLIALATVGTFSWFVVPVGAVVGALLPRLVFHSPLPRAVLLGVFLSIGIGALWGISFALYLSVTSPGSAIRWDSVRDVGWMIFPFLSIYSLPWVVAAACRRTVRGLS